MKLQHKTVDMVNGPLYSGIFVFVLPIVVMNILQLLFNAADMVVVGRFTGSQALAAIGATGSLINLMITLFLSISVGSSVVVAQKYGARQHDAISDAVHTSITISIIAGFAVMLLGLVLCRPMLILMGTPDDILDMAVVYMRIYFLGVPASMIYNFAAAIMRAVGDSRRPMNYLLIAGIINVVLNLFFVIVLHMGVAGVAWSTIISQYVALVLIALSMLKSNTEIKLNIKKLRVCREPFINIVKIGLPAGLQGLLFSISNVLIQSSVNSFGSTMVAASSAASNIENFAGIIMGSYYTMAITFTGQNMGAKKYARIDSIAKACTVLVFATWLFVGGLTILFAKPLISIFTSDAEVIALGVQRISVMMAAYFTCGVMNTFPGLTRGMGYSILPMVCTLVGACLLRIVWLNTVFAWNHTVFFLFVCYPITWAIAGAGQVASFFFARKRVLKQASLEQ